MITFSSDWWWHHDSDRSEADVRRILEEIPRAAISDDRSGGAVGRAIQVGYPVVVKKGIHEDSHGKHLTIEINNGRTWQLYVEKDATTGTFHVHAIR
jgi:hypothetical protein